MDNGTLVFDVRHTDFAGGAKGDGTTDDTSAIQAAIDAASGAGGGTVVIVDGTYLTGNPNNTTTRVPIQVKSGVRVVIMPGATVRAQTGNWLSRGVFEAVEQQDVVIEGTGTLDGQRANNAGGRIFGVLLKSVQRFAVRGLRIVNMPANTGQNAGGLGGDAVVLAYASQSPAVPCRDGVVEGLYIDNVERSGISPICAERVTIRDNTIRNIDGTNPGSAIDLEPDVAGMTIRDITIQANHVESCEWGIIVNGKGPRDVTVSGNTLRGMRNSAIHVRATDVTVSGNTVHDWAGRGIWVYNGSVGVTVSGNTLEGSYTNTAQRAAICVTDAHDVSIIGNTVRRTFTVGIQVDVKFLGQTEANVFPRDAKGIVIANNTLFAIGRDAEVGSAAISVISSSTATPPRVAQDIVIAFNSIRDGYDPNDNDAGTGRTAPNTTDFAIDVSGVTAAERAAIHIFGNRVGPEIGARINGTYNIVSGHVVDRPTINFGTVAAGAAAEQTVAVTGATTGDSVQATPLGGLEAGLQLAGAWVSAAGQVTIRVHNFSGSGVSSGRSWRVILTQH
ncbi:MAG TPA: right-handed parallel beta-helix repeat-containing protein [Longimicrobium sp.]|nr:right-handed parallel beta-helix repeat-containing protein [Longimicrobium sp.]